MGVFTGTHMNKVDKKGRVSVPKTFRALFEGEAFRVCTSSHHSASPPSKPAPRALWSESSIASKTCRCSQMNKTISPSLLKARSACLRYRKAAIVIPDEFRAACGIKIEFAFVGRGRTFQMWAPKTYSKCASPRSSVPRRAALPLSCVAPVTHGGRAEHDEHDRHIPVLLMSG